MIEKQKQTIRGMMCDSCNMKLLQYTTIIQEINRYLFMLPGSNNTKIPPKKEPNKIMLRAVPYSLPKKAMMIGF